jgi:hypothetical protein
MTGTGSFNPEETSASGGGSFTVVNGFDDAALGGPDFRGKWTITDFVGWSPEGGLQVLVSLSFSKGLNEASQGFVFKNVGLTISEDGITVDFGFELFSANRTGSAAFHLKKH